MAGQRVRIRYKGSGTDLLGKSILWAILCLITVGIYSPWAVNNFYRYVIDHTEVKILD